MDEVATCVCARVVPDCSVAEDRPADWTNVLAAANPDDRLVQAVFPLRSPQDLGIRYVRAADVWFYIARRGTVELKKLLRMLKHFDCILMANIALAKVSSCGHSSGACCDRWSALQLAQSTSILSAKPCPTW